MLELQRRSNCMKIETTTTTQYNKNSILIALGIVLLVRKFIFNTYCTRYCLTSAKIHSILIALSIVSLVRKLFNTYCRRYCLIRRTNRVGEFSPTHTTIRVGDLAQHTQLSKLRIGPTPEIVLGFASYTAEEVFQEVTYIEFFYALRTLRTSIFLSPKDVTYIKFFYALKTLITSNLLQ